MKVKSILFLLPLFLLASCGQESSITSSTSSTTSVNDSSHSPVVRTELSITKEPKTIYNLYDTIDLSGLEVSLLAYEDEQLVSSEVISDYIISIGGEVISDDYIFTTSGTVEASINYESYSVRLLFTINAIKEYSEELEIVSLPKRYYYLGEEFSLDGLELMFNSSYFTLDDEEVIFSKTVSLDDCRITVDGVDISEFIFDEAREYSISIRYSGNRRNLFAEFSVFYYREDISGPIDYQEDEDWEYNGDQMTVEITLDPDDTSYDNYYSPDEVSVDYTYYDYGKISAENWVYAPSVGDTPLLVVPVVVPGAEGVDTDEVWNNIRTAFFGSSDDLEFESLRSYYAKSSFGQLNITGAVTDFYYPERISGVNPIAKLASEAAQWAEDIYSLSLDDFDSDDDGRIDAMWMIYVGRSSNASTDYWPFSSTAGNQGTIENPLVNNYGWGGYDFLDGIYSGYENDASVLIHETGHLLGLNDYYSYSYNGYGPLGNIDMMDNNVGDHNPYSKLLLGWVKPYIVTGNARITLNSNQYQDSFIVIPYENKEYVVEDGLVHFNPFDEYIILDYYVPDNLFSTTPRPGSAYYNQIPQDKGMRVYHVDNRLANYSNGSYLLPDNPDEAMTIDNPQRVISNTEEGGTGYAESDYGLPFSYNAFDEIRLISYDHTYLSTRNGFTSSSLFKEGDIFSLDRYASQFVNGELDSLNPFSYQVEVLSFD